MNWLNNMTIKVRLAILVSVFALVMVAVGLKVMHALNASNDSIETIYANRLIPTGQLGHIIGLMRDNRTQLLLALQHDPDNQFRKMHNHPIDLHLDQIEGNIKAITALWKEYMAITLAPEEAELAKRFAETRAVFVKRGLRMPMTAIKAGKYTEANRLVLKETNTTFVPANRDVEALLKLQQNMAKAEYQSAVKTYRFVRNTTITVLLVGILLAAFMAWIIISGISSAVNNLQLVAGRMAEGDLTARSSYKGKDELSGVSRAFNEMGERFQALLREVIAAIAQLATAAEETSRVTKQTSEGIQQQRAKTENTATAMNEMSSTVQEVARNASEAATAAQRADGESSSGRREVSTTMDSIENLAGEVENASEVIHKLEKDAESIGAVLEVIRGIAEQTNLLALNAAIEAARAGEQGRGFAVVADEVRTLATRTQQSTEEIHQMIQALQDGARNAVSVMEEGRNQAQSSVEQASRAGESLNAITQAVETISDMNAQIATASEEQTAVAEEINRNIVDISDVADQTADGSQQTAAASQDLARLAEQLQSLVGQFKV